MTRLIFRLLLVFVLIVSLLTGMILCAHGGAQAVQARLTRLRALIVRFRDWWIPVRDALFACAPLLVTGQ